MAMRRDVSQTQRDWWLIGLFGLHFAHALVFARVYPQNLFDPDLLAYFIYFRNWLTHQPTLHGVAHVIYPKPLLVFTLGAFGNVHAAFLCSAAASALLGGVVYAVTRDAFGRSVGVITSALLLLDPSKAVLTLRSSADMYITLLLFLAIALAGRQRVLAASWSLLASALVKPVTIPCALYFLATGERRRRAWAAAALPLVAIPLTLLANHALLGSALGSGEFLKEFAAIRGGGTVGPGDVIHFVVWTQLIKHRFWLTAPWGFLGLILWLTADRRRLTSPLFVIPLLFVGGYLLLSIPSRYMPFFRFYWPIEIWFLGFIVFGMFECARRLAQHESMRAVATCILVVLLMSEYVLRQRSYREEFALPFENGMAFVNSSRRVLESGSEAGQRILVPLAFLPYFVWQLHGRTDADHVIAVEQAALDADGAAPDWIVDVPNIYASPKAHEFLAQLIRGREYQVRLTDGHAALLALSHQEP